MRTLAGEAGGLRWTAANTAIHFCSLTFASYKTNGAIIILFKHHTLCMNRKKKGFCFGVEVKLLFLKEVLVIISRP